MKIRIICLLFILSSLKLFSLDIYINGQYIKSYNDEELNFLLEESSLPLWYVLPLYISVQSVIIETDLITTRWENNQDPAFHEDILLIQKNNIQKLVYKGNTHLNPQQINVIGKLLDCSEMTVWSDQFDQRLSDELDLFSELHNIRIQYRSRENISEKIFESDMNRTGPDCVFINEYDAITAKAFFSDPFSGENEDEMVLPVKKSAIIPIWASSYAIDGDISIEDNTISLEKQPIDWDDRIPETALMILTPLLHKNNFYSPETKEVLTFLKENRESSENSPFRITSTLSSGNRMEHPLPVSVLTWKDKPLRPRIKPVYGAVPRSSGCPRAAEALLKHLTGEYFQSSLDPYSGYFPLNSQAAASLPEPWRHFWMETLKYGYVIPQTPESLEFLELYKSLVRLYLSDAITFDDLIKITGSTNND